QVNGVDVTKLDRSELVPGEAARDIPIEGNLFSARNDITLTLRTVSGAACLPTGTWSLVSPDSKLELREIPLRSKPNLAALPMPFFDPAVEAHAEIPIVFPAPPSPAQMRAAFGIAGYFGVVGPARLSFPVSVGTLPPGSSVVIGTEPALAGLGLLEGGPSPRMVQHPSGGANVLGGWGEDTGPGAGVPSLLERVPRRMPSLARDEPRPAVKLHRVIHFSELAEPDALVVHGRRDGEIRVRFDLPPGITFW